MDDTVAAIRGFNRYYTRVIGALGEGHLDSPYTLTEARVLYELAQHESVDVAQLRRDLALDAGYVTRILTRFEADGLITRQRSGSDARRQVVALTRTGRAAFGTLNRRASRDVSQLLERLSERERARLRHALGTVRTLLEHHQGRGKLTVRAPEPGDLGWIVQRHGELYATEYGWDDSFEALVASIVGEFAARRDPERERAWIADLDGERAGCILCVRADGPDVADNVAKLRLLLVEPSARGLGTGRRLVAECVDFARGAGYTRMVLWTQSILTAARHLYVDAGFELVESAPHRSFGADLVEETWALEL